jgi:phospholipase C
MNRREFLEKSSILLAGLGTSSVLHPAILKALAIDPAAQSTFYDAEHVVILMQENRSFDHAFGLLKEFEVFGSKSFYKTGWPFCLFSKNNTGKYAAPARLDLRNTKSTWMSSLPHSWENQQQALNKGKYDQWLQAKASGNKDYKNIPLTLGYYNREDFRFTISLQMLLPYLTNILFVYNGNHAQQAFPLVRNLKGAAKRKVKANV